MGYTVKNISNIDLEGTHDLPNSRQTLLTRAEVKSGSFKALTKGILQPGEQWDWHVHEDICEFIIVLKGKGEIFFEDSTHKYVEGDIVSIEPNTKHKVVASGMVASEFYFVRVS